MRLIWCSVLLIVLMIVRAEVSTSGYKLAIVCRKEGQLVEILDRYVTIALNNQSHVNESVQSFLKHVKDERFSIKDCSEWVGHPINAYHMVKRTAHDWWTVKQSINCVACEPTTASEEFHSSWKRILDRHGIWTNSDDVSISVRGLARLYQTYELDFKTLMSGTILNISASPLTTADGISVVKYLENEYKISWTEALLELELDDVTEKDHLLYDLALAYHVVGRSREALNILTDKQQRGTRRVANVIDIARKKAEEPEDKHPRKVLTSDNIDARYPKLCRGDIKTTNNLHCYHKVIRIPYYRVKEEVLSYVPRISRFHDVISDKEIMQVKYACKEHLEPASLVDRNGEFITNYRTRNGETALIDPSDHIARKLGNRIELLTGLDTLFHEDIYTSETFEMVNYGLGGHYLQHFDALDLKNEKNLDKNEYTGDRIATWMFYLSDVEAGGATVFPFLDLKALPIKGSAIFWYNLLPSGTIDERSLHASCPVLLGSKWIATKWILETGQEFRQPCKRNPLDEHF